MGAAAARRRLGRMAAHLVSPRPAATTTTAELGIESDSARDSVDAELKRLFGQHCHSEGPLAVSGGVLRLVGLDLVPALSPEQVEFLLNTLARWRIVSIAGQDLERFTMDHYERFANHWGAVVPHPNNFTRGGVGAQGKGDTDGEIEWIPFEERTVSRSNQTFPGELQCLEHNSPAVLVTSNFGGPRDDKPTVQAGRTGGGGSWHTDIEYEPLPLYVSMFLVHTAPTNRSAPGGTWVESTGKHNYFEGSPQELYDRRAVLPLNGETAFADTVAAFEALPPEEQEQLASVQVRRRLNEGDEGWLAPLVRVDPRSGLRSLHSPIWASRPRVRPPIEVDGMSMEDSRVFLDRLEAHCLQPQFRYDHVHRPGDVTICAQPPPAPLLLLLLPLPLPLLLLFLLLLPCPCSSCRCYKYPPSPPLPR